MTKKELEDKIAKIKKGLDNPEIADNLKVTMREALTKAENDLAKFEKGEGDKPAPRSDIYAHLAAAHPDLTRSSVDTLKGKEFDELHGKLVAEVKKSFPANASDADEIAETFLNSKVPGETAEKPKLTEKFAKAANARKGKTKAPKSPKPAKEPQSHTYDWMHKLSEGERTRAVRLTGKYSIHILDKDSSLTTRGVKVPLKAGDALLLNEEGYPMTFIVASQIEKRTAPWTETVTDDTYRKAKERVAVLEGRIAKFLKAGKSEKKKAQTGESAPPTKAPKPAPAKVEPNEAPTHAKRHSCTRSEGNVLRLTETFYNWLHKNHWQKGLSQKDVLKIVYSKGEKAGFYVQTKHYKILGNRIEWHKICPQTWDMTKLEKADYPKPGTYKLLLSESDIKKAKTTKGPAVYSTCLETYRKFYECSKDGSCSPTDRTKIKEAWSTCGDLTLKTDKLPKWMELLHEKVKSEQKPGEQYHEAMSRVAKQAH